MTRARLYDLPSEVLQKVVDALGHDEVLACLKTTHVLRVACRGVTLVEVVFQSRKETCKKTIHRARVSPLTDKLPQATAFRFVKSNEDSYRNSSDPECVVYPRSRLRVSGVINDGETRDAPVLIEDFRFATRNDGKGFVGDARVVPFNMDAILEHGTFLCRVWHDGTWHGANDLGNGDWVDPHTLVCENGDGLDMAWVDPWCTECGCKKDGCRKCVWANGEDVNAVQMRLTQKKRIRLMTNAGPCKLILEMEANNCSECECYEDFWVGFDETVPGLVDFDARCHSGPGSLKLADVQVIVPPRPGKRSDLAYMQVMTGDRREYDFVDM
jgi:hypothetical protein